MTASSAAEEQFGAPDHEGGFDEASAPTYAMPEGFEVVTDDVEAYWEPSMGPVQFTPKSIRLMDNSQDKGKSSALISCELMASATLQNNAPKKEDRTLQEFPKGTIFGIWAKAGMRELRRLGGAHVWMAPDGKRPMGKGKNDMQLFRTSRLKSGPPAGGSLELLEDARKTSISEPADAKLEGNNPPWWLDVLEDGGMAAAKKALQEKARAVQDAPIS